jgi:3-hydroxyacyl-CoA dehydrogenase/enoyl-CoA hydratase/3-hydroxybutyryl-CoA epimerase
VIRWNADEQGVVMLTLDDPRQSADTMDAADGTSMEATIDRLEVERDSITGVILTSPKEALFAGCDLNELRALRKQDSEQIAAFVREAKTLLRRLETMGRPVVSAISGAALPGALEIGLACHYRIALDEPATTIGFPEVELGLLPGAGGLVRSVRLLGVVDALMRLLLQRKPLGPRQAKELGLVDELVAAPDQLIPAAKAWIRTNPAPVQPWDAEGYQIPGGTPTTPALARDLAALSANLRKKLKGAKYTAPHHILAAAVEGAQVDLAGAMEIESRYFVELVTGQVAKNLMQAFCFDMEAVTSKRRRPVDTERFVARKVVVVGAGMMGAAISYVCAKSGVEVVLKDVTLKTAESGKQHSVGLIERTLAQGRSTPEEADKLLARITPTDDPQAAANADLMIEAVFEDLDVKARVYTEVEPYLSPMALLASNTSTLPITGLAKNVSRPADFIGLHFFSPVDRMQLLEIIKGEQTSEETLSRALDIAKQLGKIPILVNDSRGFFTSRVIETFLKEGASMLLEGVPAPTVEQAASQAGYPAPVLQLCDELNLELQARIRNEARDAIEAAGGTWQDHPGFAVINQMLAQGRTGRRQGAGFYDYRDGRRVGLWTGLQELFPPVTDPSALSLKDLKERLLFAEAIEAFQCLDEGVIESVSDANVGSILGIGFPGWTGGVLQYINGYDGGVPGFVARAHDLAVRYGGRFAPPASLIEKASRPSEANAWSLE